MGDLKAALRHGRASLLPRAAFAAAMDRVLRIYRRLLGYFGPQHWWPADSPFEVIVGALLMHQTTWVNVERAIANLRDARLLEPHVLAAASVAQIRKHVRVAGLYRSKPRWLQAFCRHLVERSDGEIPGFFRGPTGVLRSDLLAQPGVGPETADSILLYAGGRPAFVVDAFTVRIGRRIGFFDTDAYEDVQRFFAEHLPADVPLYQEYHALLVRHAKTFCRPRPRCVACPVRRMCAYGRGQRS
jgi:endonuclease-3 related protein